MPLLPRRGSYGVDAPYMLVVPGAIIMFNVTAASRVGGGGRLIVAERLRRKISAGVCGGAA
jgi:hypothetical protein